ncbi:MAG: hypothetical protein AVDCRST_MAG19-4666, partial [uncultured Thermomicrobiales bacterium]
VPRLVRSRQEEARPPQAGGGDGALRREVRRRARDLPRQPRRRGRARRRREGARPRGPVRRLHPALDLLRRDRGGSGGAGPDRRL